MLKVERRRGRGSDQNFGGMRPKGLQKKVSDRNKGHYRKGETDLQETPSTARIVPKDLHDEVSPSDRPPHGRAAVTMQLAFSNRCSDIFNVHISRKVRFKSDLVDREVVACDGLCYARVRVGAK
ncbi:MAG: hypothetical protein NVSMB1_01980 [Polyangiales bacterium]